MKLLSRSAARLFGLKLWDKFSGPTAEQAFRLERPCHES